MWKWEKKKSELDETEKAALAEVAGQPPERCEGIIDAPIAHSPVVPLLRLRLRPRWRVVHHDGGPARRRARPARQQEPQPRPARPGGPGDAAPERSGRPTRRG